MSSSFSQEFSCALTSRTMELDIDNHHQSQPKVKVPSTSQTAWSTTTVLAYHDPPPCNVSINNGTEPANEANNGGNIIDHNAFFDSLPPGYRFRPTKEELIKNYLLPRIHKEILPPNRIRDVNLYEHGPDKITERYEAHENEWYFFTPRDRKYPNGDRPNRAAGTGFWKATGADVKIIDNGKIIGYKKSLAYYEGKAPNGEKTNWIMHEYRAHHNDKPKQKTSMKLDDYVLCRIYKKISQSLKGHSREEFQAGGSSTHVRDYNIIATEAESSTLMNSQEDTLLMGASGGSGNFSSNFPLNEATPLSYGYGLVSSDENIQDDIAYQPSELPFYYPMYMQEVEDISLQDLDNFLVPIDDHLSLPHP